MKIKNIFLFIYFDLAWLLTTWLVLKNMGNISLSLTLPPLYVFLKMYSGKIVRLSFLFSLGGLAFDYISFKFNLVEFYPLTQNTTFPIWMGAIWLLFLTVMPSIPMWTRFNPSIAMCFGFFGGPLSYVMAQNIGVLKFNSPFVIALYALFWGLFITIYSKLLKKEDLHETP